MFHRRSLATCAAGQSCVTTVIPGKLGWKKERESTPLIYAQFSFKEMSIVRRDGGKYQKGVQTLFV